jgi:hypothetical protein
MGQAAGEQNHHFHISLQMRIFQQPVRCNFHPMAQRLAGQVKDAGMRIMCYQYGGTIFAEAQNKKRPLGSQTHIAIQHIGDTSEHAGFLDIK